MIKAVALIILSLVLTIKSITATGPGAKTAAACEKSANAASTSLSDAFAPAAIKVEDRGSR